MKYLAGHLKGTHYLKCLIALLLILGLGPVMGLAGIRTVEASPLSWTNVGSVGPSQETSLAVISGTLYAGTTNGVWTYSSGTWTQMSGSPTTVNAMLVVNGTLYVGSTNTGNDVWTYDGSTWTQLSGAPSNVSSLVENNGTLYAGTTNGSHDVWSYDGSTWTQMSDAPSNVYSLAESNGKLYAGAKNNGHDVWSYDGGMWTQTSGSPSNVVSLVDISGTLYAGTVNGNHDVWSYNGSAWTQMSNSPSLVQSLVDSSGTLYAGTQSGLWQYSSGSWNSVNNTPSYVGSLLDDGGTLYVGTAGGVSSYTSGQWTEIDGGSLSYVFSMVENNGTWYAGTYGGVWSLSNGIWTEMGGSPSFATSLAESSGTLYAGAMSGVWSYGDGKWKLTGDPSSGSAPSNVRSLVDVDGTLYAGTQNNSTDVWSYNGKAWTQMSNSPMNVNDLADINGTLYAGAVGSNSIWYYSDGTWTRMDSSPSSVLSFAESNGTLYAGNGNGVSYYSNGQWQSTSNSPTYADTLLDMNGTLYAGSENSGNQVWSYTNDTWTAMSGAPGQVVSLLSSNGSLVAGTLNGVESILFPPLTPTNLQGSNTTSTSTALSWDTVVGATSYNVYENGDNTPIATVTTNSGTVTGLTPGTPYTFTVSAVNAAGESSQSNSVSITTVLSAPQGLSSSDATATGTTLSWNAVTGATSYQVYENGGSTPIATATDTTDTVAGLTPGTTYTFRVSAVNVNGESAQSSAFTVNTANIGTVDLIPSNTDVVSGQSESVTGVVYDVYGVPVSNAIVDFSGDGTWSDASVTASASGLFSNTWTAPTVSTETSATVTATVYGTVYGAVNNVTPTTLPMEVAPLPSVSTKTLAGATTGSAYSQTLQSTGGFSPTTWKVVSGSIPTGLTLNATTGAISGTPTSAGTSTFTVQVQDNAGNTATQALSIDVSTLSSDASLSGLSMSSGTLSPTFSRGTTHYTESVANAVTSVSVTPSTDDSHATVTVNGTLVTSGSASTPIALNVGSNTITVAVTAQDGTTQTYTVDVTRAEISVVTPSSPPPTTTNMAPKLSTVVLNQTIDHQGLSVTKTLDETNGTTVKVDVPAGAFTTPETLTITTEAASELGSMVNNEPVNTQPAVVFGVNFSGPAPVLPVTVTLTSPEISTNSQIFKLGVDGQLTQVKATLKAGEAVISFTSDPDFVVVNPKVKPPQPVKRTPRTVDMSKLKSYERVIQIGQDQWAVPVLVRHHTTYMPVWNVMEAFRTSADLMSTWNGHTWNLLTKSKVDVQHLKLGHGKQSIDVNGKLVHRVTVIKGRGPKTDRKTTYVPVWYVMQALDRMGVTSKWSGTTWIITRQGN